jgi:L-alanine-DL-glutamate epimerase-like enolase superfamily enzyme
VAVEQTLMPTVREFELFAVDLPFRVPFRHAAAARRTSESLFLRAQLDNGVEGWGECLPRSYVSGESREATLILLRDEILPALVGWSFASRAEVISFLERADGKAPQEWVASDVPQSAAWCSVDLALLDAVGRTDGEPTWIGDDNRDSTTRNSGGECRYSGVVSADRGWRYLRSLIKIRAFGFTQVKLKLERSGAASTARTARRVLGRVDLRVDANMAWEVEEALAVIGELRTMGIDSFEQPVDATDLDGLARLVRESGAGIMVDEGLTDRDSLQRFISHQACTAVNVRISKCGGLVAAHARSQEALAAGLVLQLGCQVGESSLLSAAHVTLLDALAHRTPGVRYAEGCFGRHLLKHDPAVPSVQFRYGGRPPRRPVGPGLGVRIDRTVLERWAVDRTRVT